MIEKVRMPRNALAASALCLVFQAFPAASLAADAPAAKPLLPTPPVVLPLSEPRFSGDVGRTFRESDPPQFPQPARPGKDAPNVVVILLDDAGFGQFSTFGGGHPQPHHG